LIPIQYLFSLYLSWMSCHVSSFNLYQTLNPCSKVVECFWQRCAVQHVAPWTTMTKLVIVWLPK
jgi:hypothetical protein